MIRSLLSLCAPGGPRARLAITIFHRVTPRPDPLFPAEVDAARFERVCGWLKSWFNVLPLGEAVERLYRGDLPARSLAITFDDGYADNHAVAAPILARLGLPCTFFVASGFLDGGCMWNDVIIESLRRTGQRSIDLRGLGVRDDTLPLADVADRRAAVDALISHAKYLPQDERDRFVSALAERCEVRAPTDLMMTSDQVRDLHRQGFSIGAHTVTHPILARLGLDEARREIETGKQALERIIDRAVTLFAYPNGKRGVDYTIEAVELARAAGFDAAVSTNWGVATPQSDRFQLARFTPWDRRRVPFGLRMVRNSMAVRPVEA